MAEVKVDEELLEIAMDFTKLAIDLEGVLQTHERSRQILNTRGTQARTMYSGKAIEKLELAVETFGIHIIQLAEYYSMCHAYVRLVWDEMKALDEQLALKMEYKYLFTNAEELGVEIPKGVELPDDFVTNEDYVI